MISRSAPAATAVRHQPPAQRPGLVDAATTTRYLTLTATGSATFPVNFTLTWANNSVNVQSFTGRVTLTLDTPTQTPTTFVVRP